MATLVCDICDGSLEVGVGGLATCGDCGMRYTKERIKEKVQESRAGNGPVDNSQAVGNFKEMALHALDAGNLSEAENYANRLIELDPRDVTAWVIKGRAAGWQSTLNNIRLREAATCFAKAVELSPDDTRDATRADVADQILLMSLAVVDLRANIYTDYPDPDQANGFVADLNHISDAVASLLGRSGAVVAGVWEALATAINSATVKAWTDTIEPEYMSKRDPYPNDFQFDQYLARIGAAISLLELAIELSDEDDAADITRYENLIVLTTARRDAKSYEYTIDGYRVNLTLTSEAKRKNDEHIRKWRAKIEDLKRREGQRAVDEYWASRPTEHAELKATQARLQGELAKAKEDLERHSGRDKMSELVAQLRALNSDLQNTGKFKRAERKEIQARIDSMTQERDELTRSLTEVRRPLEAEVKRLEAELKAVNDRLERPTK